MDINKKTLMFKATPALPNPFLVTTTNSLSPSTGTTPSTGIAALEAIPVAYAPYLTGFVGRQVLAEIQIFGTTTGDVDVDFKPFTYPIEICERCLIVCKSELDAMMLDRDTFVGDHCNDNSGNDDRVCFDDHC